MRILAVNEQFLGQLMQEQDDATCVEHFQISQALYEKIGNRRGQASAAANLGSAYLSVSELRDLDQAFRWYQRGLGLLSDEDRIGRAAIHASLGTIAYERFSAARRGGAPVEQLTEHLEQARAGQQQALDLLPADHHEYRAAIHSRLGTLYRDIGDTARGIGNYQKSIRYAEACGDLYSAGKVRGCIALLLRSNGRPGDALHYARAALANFNQVGPGAGAAATHTEALIQQLEREVAP